MNFNELNRQTSDNMSTPHDVHFDDTLAATRGRSNYYFSFATWHIGVGSPRAVKHKMPTQLRWHFGIICIFCSPFNIPELWTTFQDALSEDFQKQYTQSEAYNLTLQELENFFKYHGRSCEQFKLPTPVVTIAQHKTEVYNVKQ